MKLKDLSTKFDFKKVEENKYERWVKEGYFTAGDSRKKPYAMVIPPPNITGKLHLGHVLDTTLPDIIIRRKKMQGYDTLWLPGMDHASIATQAKVEAKLKKQGISRYDLGREKFLEVSWAWKEDYAKLIRKQWATLGLSLDYTRERFTLDEGLNRAVTNVFIKMYEDKIIYRGERIINWDTVSKTALSNIEVDYSDIEGAFYYYEYKFVDEEGGLTVATTRPETMFGDQALMVHPEDERFKKYVGKKVYIPLTDTIIPVIEDDYVDKEFGTGIVKVTPAHDPNDFEVGVRHNLNFVLCMNDDGTMNNLAGRYEGLDRFDCRKKVVEDMKKSGHLFKINKIVHSVGHSERTGSIVEPRLSKQWFVSMDKLAKDVIEMQNKEEEKIHFHPTHFEKIFLNWLNNIQDWCISRQLWWGHRIPAWYKGEEVFVGEEKPEGEGWEQDPDVLDTWFSSALWPFSTMGWPDKTFDLERFFPNDTLVTGYDIIFFWVARMAFQSKYLLNTRPFKDVLIHGLIRDELGRKVSKSLNNGADMLEVIDKYGADTLRYFISTTGGPGQDFRYSDEKLESTWNFINKIWNIARYIGIQFDNNEYIKENIDFGSINSVDKWILSKTNQIIREVDENFEKFEFGEVARTIYNFVWDDFASWYLEMTKVVFQEEDKRLKINTCSVLDYVLTVVIKLLHPFIPFVTEEIYQSYHKDSIVISNWPVANKDFDFHDSSDILIIFDIITAIRNIRAEKNVPNSKKIDLQIECRNDFSYKTIENHLSYLQRFTNYDNLIITKKGIDGNKKVIKVLTNVTIAIPLETLVDREEELLKLEENKTLILSEIKRCESMLGNKNFITKAPAFKIDEEKLKLKNYTKQLEAINKSIDDLR